MSEQFINQKAQDTFNLISQEINPNNIIGANHLIEKINNNKPLKGYFGTAPTGRIHIGYMKPFMKIADIINSGCELCILLADVHAFLDSRKSDLEDENKMIYYKELITESLKLLNVDMTKIHFVIGSSYQYNKSYMQDLLKYFDVVTDSQAKHAGAEVVKQCKEAKLSGLVYPLMQSLDEEHLSKQLEFELDFELGGNDQRKIFTFSVDHLGKLYPNRKFTYIMNDMISGLRNKSLERKEDYNAGSHKMSSSDSAGKIDLLFTHLEISQILKSTYCLEGEINDNTILDLCRCIIFPLLMRLNHNFVVIRKEKYGGNFIIKSYDELVEIFLNKKLHPEDLKISVAKLLFNILKPLRDHFESDKMKQILNRAYPSDEIKVESVNDKPVEVVAKSKRQLKKEAKKEKKKDNESEIIIHS